jgi:hypothetical protein
MSDNVQTALFDILKKIQEKLVEHDKRFDTLEEIIRKNRRDVAGMMVIGKAMAGDFAEQMAAITERVEALEANRN